MSGGLSDREWLLIRLPLIAERSTRINIDIKFVLVDLNVRGLRGIVSLLALFYLTRAHTPWSNHHTSKRRA
jgi:hypothetical protein